MIREASLILPNHDNSGADLANVHKSLQSDLLSLFGGYTAQQVTGAWRDEETGRVYYDESTEYRIATVWEGKKPGQLERLGAVYARKAGQLAVYIRHASGESVFVSPKTESAPRIVYDEAA